MKKLIILLVFLMLIGSACGVKGPPLPPIPLTPQQIEAQEAPKPSPTPKATGLSNE